MLKLNQDNIVLIVFAKKHKVKSFGKLQLNFDENIVSKSSYVRKLGFLSNPQHAATNQAFTKSRFHQILNIGRIWSHISITGDASLHENLLYALLLRHDLIMVML